MEPLYPPNIIERRYPILREQREKAEREAMAEKQRAAVEAFEILDEVDVVLYENAPVDEGVVGSNLNTLA